MSRYADYHDLKIEVANKVATVTLNRPEARNAINQRLIRELRRIWDDLGDDPQVNAVLLTGAGDWFSVGGDVKAMSDRPGGDVLEEGEVHDPMISRRLVSRHLELDKPIVCAINGAAAGYGMDLALGCDIRLASENAKMGAVFAKRGIVPESGGCWYLPRLLGWAKAAEVAFLGDVLDAQQSLEVGLVNKVVPHDELMNEARAWAHKIANNAPLAVQATKRMMRLGQDETFEAAVDHILLQLLPLTQTDDFKESLSAFAERREPAFKGR